MEVHFSIAQELLASIFAYLDTNHHRMIDLGPGWVRRVGKELSEEYKSGLARHNEEGIDGLLTLGHLLAWRSPASSDVNSFLAWCSTLSSGDLYELVANGYLASYGIPANLVELRDNLVDMLDGWNNEYFSQLDSAILADLQAAAVAVRSRLDGADPQALVEDVSNGVVLLPSPEVTTVVLVPQYHVRPWTLVTPYQNTTLVLFPQPAAAPGPGEPLPRYVRTAKALGDSGRMRILRFLGERPRSFTEVVAELGLANSTVNYHLGLLRAAGLVQVFSDVAGRGSLQYGLRGPALGDALHGITEYIERESEGDR